MLSVHERTWNMDLGMMCLMRLIGSILIGVTSCLLFVLDFHHFIFHLLDLLLKFILFPNLSLNLLSVLILKQLLSSG